MTKLANSILAACAALILTCGTAGAASLATRQHHQRDRTRLGIAAGQINKFEAHGLVARQSRIQDQIVRDRADGRGFTLYERSRANRLLDRQNRDIARARHNSR